MTLSTVEIRNRSFDVGDGIPRHWHGGRRSVTTFFDNLSVFFPAGERFFVSSVRAHRRFVKDEKLTREVNGFTAQEGFHGREHIHYNEMLRQRGYPVEAMERKVKGLLHVARKLPRRWQLGITCALEHLTALLAHFLLDDPRLLEGADPTMAALWRWHAAEESEHKSVAYDVYLAAGGNDLERCAMMVLASTIFWAKVVEQQMRMMHVDGTLLSTSEWAALGRFLFVEPGGMAKLFRLYLSYYRPGFHPRDVDSESILERWKSEHGAALAYAPAP